MGSVQISNEDGSHDGILLDLSLKGAMIKSNLDWSPTQGANYHLHILLEDRETAIIMECVLAHIQGQYLGFACHNIDLDSISHLKRLVELNLENHDLLERELSAMGHLE
jgi:hypothetical protein